VTIPETQSNDSVSSSIMKLLPGWTGWTCEPKLHSFLVLWLLLLVLIRKVLLLKSFPVETNLLSDYLGHLISIRSRLICYRT
jgi:hypothetical protein